MWKFHSEKGTFAKFRREGYAVEAGIGQIQAGSRIRVGNVASNTPDKWKMNRVKEPAAITEEKWEQIRERYGNAEEEEAPWYFYVVANRTTVLILGSRWPVNSFVCFHRMIGQRQSWKNTATIELAADWKGTLEVILDAENFICFKRIKRIKQEAAF